MVVLVCLRCVLTRTADMRVSIPKSRHLFALKCACLCTSCSHNTQLLPSASFHRHNFSRLIIAVNHRTLPVVFFFFYPAASLCPCPLPPTLLRARLDTARHNESSCICDGRAVDRLTAHFDGDCCQATVWSSDDILLILSKCDAIHQYFFL